jgi:endo-1,4-beta-D-glucanase Y
VRDHPSKIDERLMAWQIPESNAGEDSAFDGDADIAYALLLAHAQWGSSGEVGYASEAQTVITAIKESTFGPDSHLPLLGDWVDINGVGTEANQYTPRSSDFMPAHFRSYGRSSGDPFWNEALTAVQATITSMQNNHSPETGLLPDFIEPVSAQDHTPRPADPGFLEADTDGDYSYNAGRDPWRIGTDALLNNDATSLAQVRRMADWIAESTGQDPMQIAPGYHLDGDLLPGDQYFTSFFATPFAVALMTRPSRQDFLNDLYDAVYQTHEGYYEDSVTLLSLLVITGNYWDPTVGAQVERPLYLPSILARRPGT